MGKGSPFFEVFTSALLEDYRFPVLELFIFLYAIGTFVFASMAGIVRLADASAWMSNECLTFSLVSSLQQLPLYVFVVLLLKNVAYGAGNDLDKGVIQTLLSYPLTRKSILTAKLFSSIGVSLLLFLGTQIFSLFLIAPDLVLPNMGIVLLTYLAVLTFPLLLTALVLVLTLSLKRGGIALVIGVVLFFGIQILTTLFMMLAVSCNSDIPLKIYAIINPLFALQEHYDPGGVYPPIRWHEIWTVSYSDALLYLGAGYMLVILLFIIAYMYFERRLEI